MWNCPRRPDPPPFGGKLLRKMFNLLKVPPNLLIFLFNPSLTYCLKIKYHVLWNFRLYKDPAFYWVNKRLLWYCLKLAILTCDVLTFCWVSFGPNPRQLPPQNKGRKFGHFGYCSVVLSVLNKDPRRKAKYGRKMGDPSILLKLYI